MMRWTLIVALMALAGCSERPVATSSTNNPNVPVALLFEHEGCKVFRFMDVGRHHYYVVCAGARTQQAINGQMYSQGKTSATKSEIVSTVERQ